MTNVRVSFVTNRNATPNNKIEKFGTRFNEDGVAGLRFGYADFVVDGGVATMAEPYVFPDAKVPRTKDTVPAKGSGEFLDQLRVEMLKGRDTLIFIHGFNVSFVEALKAGALLAAELADTINVVVFTWPSDGQNIPYMSYYSDREDARASGPALARAYLKLFDFVKELREADLAKRLKGDLAPGETALCDRCIHILAHSMGNYVLRQGIQAIKAKDPNKLVRMFDQVVMAAADEDDDAFESDEKLRILPTLARRITVYHNRRDRALIISDKTKANPDRLGSEGPRMLDLLPKKVTIVDCSLVASIADTLALHSYYINSPPVARDIAAVLADGEPDSIPGRTTIRIERSYRIDAAPA